MSSSRGGERSSEKWRYKLLKGQCHEIFDFWFFSWISFPQAPEYTIRAVLNFFENSRRCLQLKVHHRCCSGGKWKKSSILWLKIFFEVLIALFWYLWEVELTYRYIFVFKFTLRSQQPDIVPIICRRCRWYQWQICRRCCWYWWCTLICEYLPEFSTNFETVLMVFCSWNKTRSKNLVTLSL